MKIPKIMRYLDEESDEKEQKFGIYDCRSNLFAFTTYVLVAPTAANMTLREFRDDFELSFRENAKSNESLSWTATRGLLPGYLSAPFAVPEEKGNSLFVYYGLVKLAHNRVAVLTFTEKGQTEADRAKYDEAALRILNSVTDSKTTKKAHSASTIAELRAVPASYR